jgi:monovalent cation/proton antiporter MnhG/PhaG subunit
MFDSILYGLVTFLGWFFIILGGFFVAAGAIGFLRMKDFFIKLHAVKLSNCYGITFILIGFMIRNYFEISILKFIIILILNLMVTLTCIHAIGRRAYIEGIKMDAKRRDEIEESEQ